MRPDVKQELDNIKVSYRNGRRYVRCFCGEEVSKSIVDHLRKRHQEEWDKWCSVFVELRNSGSSYFAIVREFKTREKKFLFTTSVVQRETQRMLEEKKAELRVPKKEKISKWHPENLEVGRGTVWSFKKRGNWAVHKGDYRGNWAPEIPRILISRYTQKNDLILDPFVGGGTTLIEAWLADRRSVGIDISQVAVDTSSARIEEMIEHAKSDRRVVLEEAKRPIILHGDARKLRSQLKDYGMLDKGIHLVCTHPPYLDSLKYTLNIEGDLSRLSDPVDFCNQIQVVANNIYSLLADDGHCCVLMGDVRKANVTIPLAFYVLERFLKEDFRLKTTIIKTQHQDSSTRFWYSQNKLDFLITHEYLFILKK